MKAKLILMFLVTILLTSFVNAQNIQYGPNPYGYGQNNYNNGYDPYYGMPFNPFEGFSLDAYKNSFSQDTSNFYNGKNSFNKNQDYLSLFGQYNNYNRNYNLFGSTNTMGSLSMLDGYSFTKGPCVVRHINIDLKGKDFKATEKICDNIEGTFYKNNDISNSFSNNNAYNDAFNGQDVLFNGNLNSQSLNQNSDNTFGHSDQSSQDYKTVKVNFGKGDLIIYN